MKQPDIRRRRAAAASLLLDSLATSAAGRSRRVRRRLPPDDRPDEEWRPIAGWGAAYEVSSLGRVRKPAVSVVRSRGGTQHYRAQLLRPHLRSGAPLVQLLLGNGRHRAIRVARLVAQAFLPPPPPGAVLVFRNGEPDDVRAANLAWSDPAGK